MNFVRGLPGHPFHPPLTDATIGAQPKTALEAQLGLSPAATNGSSS